MKPNSRHRSHALFSACVMLLALSACGGGSGGAGVTQGNSSGNTLPLTQEPGAPSFLGSTATDGVNWFNYRRRQMGLPQLTRNVNVDAAAQAHSDYQRLNNTITHSQIAGRPGFTGSDLLTRLNNAGYIFTPRLAYAYGEVISSTSDASGFYMAEELIAAIYHRFVIFEPSFKEVGAGSAVSSGGSHYFTTNFTANNGYGTGIGNGNVAIYPFADQQRIPTIFNSDYESPDPVAGQNEVGYPVSVHANIGSQLSVTSFSITPRGGTRLETKLLINQTDREVPSSAAAIIPLRVLNANTLYDVEFVGSVDGNNLRRTWSFRTR